MAFHLSRFITRLLPARWPALIDLQPARVSTHRFHGKLVSGLRPGETYLLLGELECFRLSAGFDPDKIQSGCHGCRVDLRRIHATGF